MQVGTSIPPKVSVVMPAWNADRTIKYAVESVLGQTYRDLELLVCNDASHDDTSKILSSFTDDRLRVLHNNTNLGEGGARDRAIAGARGEWLAVIDADDVWLPERLEKLIAALDSQTDVMVFDDIYDCHDAPEGLVKWRRLRGRRAFGADGKGPVRVAFQDYIRQRRLLIKPLFPARAVSDMGLCHSSRRFGADTEYFLRLIVEGLQLVYVPEAMYLYRITPGSMSANPKRNELMLGVLKQAKERMPLDPSDSRALEVKIASVQRDMSYASFLQVLKGQKWPAVFAMLRKNPVLLLEFVARLSEDVPYRLHRWLHQADGR